MKESISAQSVINYSGKGVIICYMPSEHFLIDKVHKDEINMNHVSQDSNLRDN